MRRRFQVFSIPAFLYEKKILTKNLLVIIRRDVWRETRKKLMLLILLSKKMWLSSYTYGLNVTSKILHTMLKIKI